VAAAFKARAAVESGKDPAEHYAAARAIASTYYAELVANGDLEGMVVGPKFTSGHWTRGAGHIFYVA
jgi:hypothetical protein